MFRLQELKERIEKLEVIAGDKQIIWDIYLGIKKVGEQAASSKISEKQLKKELCEQNNWNPSNIRLRQHPYKHKKV